MKLVIDDIIAMLHVKYYMLTCFHHIIMVSLHFTTLLAEIKKEAGLLIPFS